MEAPRMPNAEPRNEIVVLHSLVVIFMISVVVPIRFYLGPVLLMPYRVVLLVALVPCLVGLLSGRAGRIVASDIFIVLFWMWASVALIQVHGLSQIEALGVQFLEMTVPYMLARVYVRNADQFESVVRLLLRIIIILLPFALYESVTGDPIILSLLRNIASTPDNIALERRLGIDRAQVTFEHPILFGVFSASAVALSVYVLNFRKKMIENLRYIPIISLAVICSMSTGALLSSMLQLMLICWDKQKVFVKNRWKVLLTALVVAYLAVELISNRDPFQVFVSYLTLNSDTSGWRLIIWEYGSAEVWRHPLFGIGFNDWLRPDWMHSASVDNFWLLTAMRYGLPGLLLLCAAIFAMWRALAKLQGLSSRLKRYRSGYLISLGSLMVGMCTVHIWNATYVWFMFLLGSALWLTDAAEVDDAPAVLPCRPGYRRSSKLATATKRQR
jgi:hypothetical protein